MANTTEPSVCDGDAAFLSNYFDHPRAGKVTVGLVSHWPYVTDFSDLSTYGLDGLREGYEHPA